MRIVIFLFIAVVFSKPSLCQNISFHDSSNINCKVQLGKLTAGIGGGDSGIYVHAKSKYNSFIEFSIMSWGSLTDKYRVEKLLDGQILSVTKIKTNSYDSSSAYYIAVDSNMINKRNIKGRHLKYLKKRNLYTPMYKIDLLLLEYFSGFINSHNLQKEYLNFKPNSYVGWLKVKD
jgi:hypothetical protein